MNHRLALLGIALSALILVILMRHEGLGGVLGGGTLLGCVVLLALLAVGLALLACTSLLCWALWPSQVGRARQRLEALPTRCTLTGVMVVLAQVWGVQIAPDPLHGPLILLWMLWDGIALAQGFPALASLCGQRLAGDGGPRGTAVGTAVLACGSTLPVIGWAMALGCVLQCVGTHFMVGRLGQAS